VLKHTLDLEVTPVANDPELKDDRTLPDALKAYQARLDAEVEPAMAAATCLIQSVGGPKHLQDTVPLRLCLCRDEDFLVGLLNAVEYEPPPKEEDGDELEPTAPAIASAQTVPPRGAPPRADQEAGERSRQAAKKKAAAGK
jgi:hypothetical protein